MVRDPLRGLNGAQMGSLSAWHIIIVGMVAVLLFGGRGRISELMGDVAKGIKSFREGVNGPSDI